MIDADRLQLHMPLQKHHKNNVKLIQHNIGRHSEDQGIWLWYDLEWTSVVPQLTTISVTSDYRIAGNIRKVKFSKTSQ